MTTQEEIIILFDIICERKKTALKKLFGGIKYVYIVDVFRVHRVKIDTFKVMDSFSHGDRKDSIPYYIADLKHWLNPDVKIPNDRVLFDVIYLNKNKDMTDLSILDFHATYEKAYQRFKEVNPAMAGANSRLKTASFAITAWLTFMILIISIHTSPWVMLTCLLIPFIFKALKP